MSAPRYRFDGTYYLDDDDGSVEGFDYVVPLEDMTYPFKIEHTRWEHIQKSGEQVRIGIGKPYSIITLRFDNVLATTYQELRKIKKIDTNVLFYPDSVNNSGFSWTCKPIRFRENIQDHKRSEDRIFYTFDIVLQTSSPTTGGGHYLGKDLLDFDVYGTTLGVAGELLADDWYAFIGDLTSGWGE